LAGRPLSRLTIPAGNLIIIPTKIIGKDDVDAYAANLKAMSGN
jgi:ribose transport system substrate-binding protein